MNKAEIARHRDKIRPKSRKFISPYSSVYGRNSDSAIPATVTDETIDIGRAGYITPQNGDGQV
jgi:hypothetical protein